jgi:hypothetical protein
MKKIIAILFVLGFSLSAFSQKSYSIVKWGTAGIKLKVQGNLTFTDTTVYIKADYKGRVTEATFKIVNKSEVNGAGSYMCSGMFGTSDKHMFSILPDNKIIIWKSVSSFDNSQVEQILVIE